MCFRLSRYIKTSLRQRSVAVVENKYYTYSNYLSFFLFYASLYLYFIVIKRQMLDVSYFADRGFTSTRWLSVKKRFKCV